MKRYRAIRQPGKTYWNIEEFDTEFQIASMWDEIDYCYATRADAEQVIFATVARDRGAIGEWIDGPI